MFAVGHALLLAACRGRRQRGGDGNCGNGPCRMKSDVMEAACRAFVVTRQNAAQTVD